MIAEGGASAGFQRARSLPRNSPRPGSLSAATSAGTRQGKSTFSRRDGPVAAKRSSGLPRRQGGSPLGRTGAGVNRRRGGAQHDPDGDCNREGGRGNKNVAAVHKAGEERRCGATPATATQPPSSQIL
jgi:hypothetical protein